MILATDEGPACEVDVCAKDAPTAVVFADDTVRQQRPEVIVTNVHARRVRQ